MNLFDIYSKTPKGLRESNAWFGKLSSQAKRVLTLVDGKLTGRDILEQTGKLTPDELLAILTTLEEEGYIRPPFKRDAGGEWLHTHDANPAHVHVMEVEELNAESLDFTNFTAEADQNENAHLAAEQQSKEEAERRQREEDEAKAKAEQEEKARLAAEEKARLEAERLVREQEKARAKAEAEEKARQEAEAREAARLEAERKAQAEEQARLQAEAERRQREEDEARAKAEREEQARLDAEEKARQEAERLAREQEKARAKAEAEEKARQEAEAREAARLEAEHKAQEEEQARLQAEAERRQREEDEARAKAEREEKARLAAEEKARQEAERLAREQEEARAKAEAEEKARQEAEAARQEAERKAQEEEQARLQAEAERRQREEDEARAKAEQEEQARLAAEEKARQEAERLAREQEKARAKAEAEEKSRLAAEQKAQRKAEEDARRAAEKAAKAEAKQRAREEADAKALEKAQQKALARSTKPGVNLGWMKQAVKGLLVIVPLVLAVLVGLVHFVNLTMLASPIEKLAESSIGEPVKVAKVHVSLFPQPHFLLEGISIGDTQDIKIASIRAVPVTASLLEPVKNLQSLEIHGLALSPANAGRPVSWVNTTARSGKLVIGSISLKNITFGIPGLSLPPLDGKVTRTDAGDFSQLELTSTKQDMALQVTPQSDGCAVKLAASNWKPPVETNLQFDEVNAEASVNRSRIAFSRIDAKVYGGNLSATATITWPDDVQASGNFTLSEVALPVSLAAFGSPASLEGRLSAKASFSSKSGAAAKLLDAIAVDASFKALNGKINGIDLGHALLAGHAKQSDEVFTRFDKLNGTLQYREGTYRYKQLALESTSLRADGNLVVSPDQSVTGKLSADLSAASRRLHSSFNLSGTTGSPQLQSGGH